MNYTTFGMYPQSKKVEGVVINGQADSRDYYLGSDNCLYAECNGDYFKIEPIRWKILSGGSEQILVTDKIIDAHRFSQYSNNYKNSEIRSWLNSEFYNLTFTDAEKSRILATVVDNGTDNISDNVFLLSRKEAEQYFEIESNRIKKATDYAIARAMCAIGSKLDKYAEDRDAQLASLWIWLRSPSVYESNLAQVIDRGGDFVSSVVYGADNGVCPAIKISC